MIEGIEALRRAKELLGSEQAVAGIIGRTQSAVNQILSRGKRVPAEWCLPIERATAGKITRHQLRPDLYPSESTEVTQ
jgi:DNA-binding transcriptional regulator YdaS (Cro superfamily)